MGVIANNCYLCGAPGRMIHRGMKDQLFGTPGSWNYRICPRCDLVWITPQPKNINQAYADYHTHGNQGQALMPPPETRVMRLKSIVARAAFGYSDRSKNFPNHYPDHRRNHRLGRALSLIGPLRDIAGRHVMWLKKYPQGRLLDVGCGDGTFLARMKAMGWDVAGIEPDPVAAACAGKKLNHIFTGDLEQAGFAENSFDAITLCHVIEHLPAPVRTLRECRRILKPGGRIIIITPNTESLGRKWFGNHWRGWEPPRHLFLFTRKSLQIMAQTAGFSDFSINTHATSAVDVWKASVNLKNSARKQLPISKALHSKWLLLQAVGFWLLEYTFNLFLPWGEELVLIAKKDGQT